MEKSEYLEFDLDNSNRFDDLNVLLNMISESKKNGDIKTDNYWLDKFPDYALKHFYFAESDLKPKFPTKELDGGTWHFYSMIQHLVENLDVQFLNCKNIGNGKARLEFYACGYPYGGITGLIMFIKSFGFKATEIDEGGGVYQVNWNNETEFELKEMKWFTIMYKKIKRTKPKVWLKLKRRWS